MYYGNKRKNKAIIVISLAIPVLIGSLRYGVGTDYGNYVSIYNNLSNLSFSNYFIGIASNLEFGFFTLVKISKLITGDYTFLFASSCFLTVLFFYKALKRYDIKHSALVYFLFLTTIFPTSFNTVRQSIAISICFFAFSYIIERKPKKYLLWIFIASLFHVSAIILLPFYFINRLVKNKKGHNKKFIIIKSLLLASIILLLLPYVYEFIQMIPFLNKYTIYQSISADGNNYIIYLNIVILAVILLFYKKLVLISNTNIYLYVFTIMNIVLLTLGFASPFVKRIALYFSLFSPILMTYLCDIFSDRLGRFISYSLLILYGLLFFYISFYLMGQADIIPYRLLPGAVL